MIYYILENNLSNTKTPEDLSKWMRSNIKYEDFTKLKSPKEVFESKSGACHDQVIFEIEEFKKMNISPGAYILIEVDPETNQGGVTHSFVYYKKDNKYYWFENAWGGQEGIHQYDSIYKIKKDIIKLHKDGMFGNVNKFPDIEMQPFIYKKPGQDLQELINNNFK